MDWSRIGKPRSRMGKWIDKKGITQQELSIMSGISDETIGQLARDERRPSWRTEKKLMQALRHYDSEVSAEDFWG